jgi:hypothetical protein
MSPLLPDGLLLIASPRVSVFTAELLRVSALASDFVADPTLAFVSESADPLALAELEACAFCSLEACAFCSLEACAFCSLEACAFCEFGAAARACADAPAETVTLVSDFSSARAVTCALFSDFAAALR